MTEGVYDYDDDPFDGRDDNDDDDDADETTPFIPSSSSTPGPFGEELPMKTMQKEKSGLPGLDPSWLPDTSQETSFGGSKVTFEHMQRRLERLRRDSDTGLLDTTKMDPRENPLSAEDKEKEIQKVKDFIKARYPNADLTNLPIRFSTKKPMDIVVLGPKGGETKVALDDRSDLQKSFLNATFVKRALGESFEEIRRKENEEFFKERQSFLRSQREMKTVDDSLKTLNQNEIERKETERVRSEFISRQEETIRRGYEADEMKEEIKKLEEAKKQMKISEEIDKKEKKRI